MTGLSTSELWTLLALVALHRRGRVVVRDVAKARGVAVSTVHTHLTALRRVGLVTWENDRAGTLRPRVEAVA